MGRSSTASENRPIPRPSTSPASSAANRSGTMPAESGEWDEMGVEQLAMSSVAVVGRHPWLSNARSSVSPNGGTRSWTSGSRGRIRCTTGCVPAARWPTAGVRQWFVFGYDEVQEVLRSPHTATAPIAQLLLSTSRYRQLSPSARSNFSHVAARQRRARPHQVALSGEQGVHTTADRLLRADWSGRSSTSWSAHSTRALRSTSSKHSRSSSPSRRSQPCSGCPPIVGRGS